VAPSFKDFSVLHHQNAVRVPDRRQPVRNHDNRLLPRLDQLVQRLLHLELTLRVQSRGRLVEEQDFGFSNQSAGDGNPLLLTTGELNATLADQRVVAGGEHFLVFDEVESVGLTTGVVNLLVGDVFDFEAVANVFADGAGYENGFLLDEGNLGFVPEGLELLDVSAAEQNFTATGFVVPDDQRNDTRLSAARVADECGD